MTWWTSNSGYCASEKSEAQVFTWCVNVRKWSKIFSAVLEITCYGPFPARSNERTNYNIIEYLRSRGRPGFSAFRTTSHSLGSTYDVGIRLMCRMIFFVRMQCSYLAEKHMLRWIWRPHTVPDLDGMKCAPYRIMYIWVMSHSFFVIRVAVV